MFDLDPSGSIFAQAKYENQSHLFILQLVSGEARVWQTVPMPGAQNCVKVVFLSFNQIKIFMLCFLKYIDVVYLYTLRAGGYFREGAKFLSLFFFLFSLFNKNCHISDKTTSSLSELILTTGV
jgi:hypothetical protein